jgi:predicted O-methyltransferase YrrM
MYAIDEYLEKNMSDSSDVLKALEHETWQKLINPRMCSGAYQGRVLSALSKMISPNKILELGTYTGYSAIALSEGLQAGGSLDTLDINDELQWIHQKYLKQLPITVHYGDAKHTMSHMDLKVYDLVFVDADKQSYFEYKEILENGLKKGAWVLWDNVLWNGKVFHEAAEKDVDTQTLQKLNKALAESDNWETVILPIRDGLTLSRKI